MNNQIFIYTLCITAKRATSDEIRLHRSAPVQHSSEKRSQRWRAVGDTVFTLSSSEIEPQTSRTDSDAFNKLADWPVIHEINNWTVLWGNPCNEFALDVSSHNRRAGQRCFGLLALISHTQVKYIHRSEWITLPKLIIPPDKYIQKSS